jgi:hypothetical protein
MSILHHTLLVLKLINGIWNWRTTTKDLFSLPMNLTPLQAATYGHDYEDGEYEDILDEHDEEGTMFVVISFPSLEPFIDVNTNLDDMLLYSDSEDECDDNETTEIDSQRQCVDVPDEQVPHPPTRPTSTTFPNPPKDTRIEIIPFPLESAGAPITNPGCQQTHYEAYVSCRDE